MLQNKAGISKSSGIPAKNCIHFNEGYILLSNIRLDPRKMCLALLKSTIVEIKIVV